MSSVGVRFEDESLLLDCRKLTGHERAGVASRFVLTCYSPDVIDFDKVVGKKCGLIFETASSGREFIGTVTEMTAIATSQEEAGRRYRLVVESSTCWGRWRRQTRVFQHKSVDKVIGEVLQGCGWKSDDVKFKIDGSNPPIAYVTQYAETDENFVRRLCETYGLYFVFGAADGKEKVFFRNASKSLQPEAPKLELVDGSNLNIAGEFVWDPRWRRVRRPGKVSVRDYDPLNPGAKLQGESEDGAKLEKGTEVYEAPAGFSTEKAGGDTAKLRLESLRNDAATLLFTSNAVRLAPGTAFELESAPDLDSRTHFDGKYVVTAVQHEFDVSGDRYLVHVTTIPLKVPLRLPRTAHRPRIHGLHSAVVTGASGEEIHPDKDGNVFVRFQWDLNGPTDQNSSLPIRAAQPNTPGSMVIPRVGWEVFVAFEDGDPDKPYVIGRAYNSKQMPPFPLPANKTVTSVRSFSSPGGGGYNSIHFDDAAGRQHLAINASFGKTTTVANNMKTQTAKVEEIGIKGDQSRTVGANETISVKESHKVKVGSQNATVGATQSIFVKGKMYIGVDSETVAVGGALLEKVGNPVTGLVSLGTAAALQVAGAAGGKLGSAFGGSIGGMLGGKFASLAGGAAVAAFQAPKGQGASAALSSVAGGLAGMVPGGGAVLASVKSAGGRFPWEPDPAASGSAAPGGGSAGEVSDAGGAASVGPGHRNEKVTGALLEAVGAAIAVTAGNQISWETSGAAATSVGGAHILKAKAYTTKVAGLSVETLGGYHIVVSGKAARETKKDRTTTISGSLKAKSGGSYTFASKDSITLKANTLTLSGSHVTFRVGGSRVSSSPGGLLIKSSTIEFDGAGKQSGSTTH